MEIEEPQVCPNCKQTIDTWNWIRFAGKGPWRDKNKYYGCPHCEKRYDGSDVPEPEIVPTQFISVDRRMKAHHKDICSRVIGDDGNTVLKGKEGLAYMEKHAKEQPGYVNRLKEYHNL